MALLSLSLIMKEGKHNTVMLIDNWWNAQSYIFLAQVSNSNNANKQIYMYMFTTVAQANSNLSIVTILLSITSIYMSHL